MTSHHTSTPERPARRGHRQVAIRELPGDRILIDVAGEQVLAPASCPHRGGRLRFGRVNPRTMRLTCPLHQATFDLRTGARVAGPACGPLRVSRLPVRHPTRPTATEADRDQTVGAR